MIRIDHVNVVVTEMERSVRFYTTYLGRRRGFETVLEGEWVERVTGVPGARAHCVFLVGDAAGTRLELLQYLQPCGEALPGASLANTPGLRHLAFNVQSVAVLQALEARLREDGVTVVSPPVGVPFNVADLGRKHLFYFLDPDGTIVEAAAYEEAAG